MRKILLFIFIFFAVIFIGCAGNKGADNEIAKESPKAGLVKSAIPKITRATAQEKVLALSEGLEVYHDDMKEFTLCRCRYDSDEDIVIVPYVVLSDDNYSVTLNYHILYSGREPLHFDTMYIKTSEGVKHFKYKNVSVLYGYNVIEEYNGIMSNEVYDVLKQAVNTGYGKIRLEGRQMEERDLKQKELDDFAKVFKIYEFFRNAKVEE